jgi:dienelactone hydrolase
LKTKTKTTLFLVGFFIFKIASAQYQGPIPPITNGYGSDGALPVAVVNIPNDYYLLRDISVFYPSGTTSPIPVIMYSHAYGGNDTTRQSELLRHMASKGYAVVFVPYKTTGVTIEERYQTLSDGFIKAAETLPKIIDTTRIGCFGHSFGGGATPAIAYQLFAEKSWGANGKFIYCSAPWYTFGMNTQDLDNFPADCNMLTVLYDNDVTNDHRLGMDIFRSIAIGNEFKDCILVQSDTVDEYIYKADHQLPTQYEGDNTFDALDYYVTFRLFDALAEYTFTGNSDAKLVALGNNGPAQTDMGTQLSPLIVTDEPIPAHPQSDYMFMCDTVLNERVDFCEYEIILSTVKPAEKNFLIYPNPTIGDIHIVHDCSGADIEITVYDLTGQKLMIFENQLEINIEKLPSGMYLLRLNEGNRSIIQKIIKLI